VALSWSASTDNIAVTGYKVYKNGAAVATVGGTSYTATGLSANTSYNFQVTAIDAASNESGKSSLTQKTSAAPASGSSSGSTSPAPPAPKAPAPAVPVDQPVVVQRDISNSGYLVSIDVRDSKNQAVKGASVNIGGKIVKTDANGSAGYTGLVAGSYDVLINANGKKITRNINVEDGDATVVQKFAVILPKGSLNGLYLSFGIGGGLVLLAALGYYVFKNMRGTHPIGNVLNGATVTAGGVTGGAAMHGPMTQTPPTLVRPTNEHPSDSAGPTVTPGSSL
jgi:hypothetical protein